MIPYEASLKISRFRQGSSRFLENAFLRKLRLAEARCVKPNRFRAGSSRFREAEVVFGPRRA
jgi:hypothetical protein